MDTKKNKNGFAFCLYEFFFFFFFTFLPFKMRFKIRFKMPFKMPFKMRFKMRFKMPFKMQHGASPLPHGGQGRHHRVSHGVHIDVSREGGAVCFHGGPSIRSATTTITRRLDSGLF